MITFFHAADTHFGTENYGKIDQKTGLHSRFLDFVSSLEECVTKAIDGKVDFFLFCGDAYKTAYPTPTHQKQFLRLLFRLQQAKIPVVMVVGNHDHPLSFGKIHALDVFNTIPLDGIHVFSKPGVMKLETKSGPVQVVGIPWPLRNNLVAQQDHRFKTSSEVAAYISEKVGGIIANFASGLDEKIPALLAGHLTVSSGLFSGSEKCAIIGDDPLFLPSQLALKPFDYVALGHLHRYQNLNPNGYPAVVYSGSTERIDFGERKEKKGFCSVALDEKKEWGKRASHTFIELAVRPMIQIEVVLENGKNQTKQILAEIEKHEIGDAIVKIVYHIDGDFVTGSADAVDLLAVQRACSSAMCLASITPVRKQMIRERRAELSVAMDFVSIVDKYLKVRGENGVDLKKVKEKALRMHNELEESCDDKAVLDQYLNEEERSVSSP